MGREGFEPPAFSTWHLVYSQTPSPFGHRPNITRRVKELNPHARCVARFSRPLTHQRVPPAVIGGSRTRTCARQCVSRVAAGRLTNSAIPPQYAGRDSNSQKPDSETGVYTKIPPPARNYTSPDSNREKPGFEAGAYAIPPLVRNINTIGRLHISQSGKGPAGLNSSPGPTSNVVKQYGQRSTTVGLLIISNGPDGIRTRKLPGFKSGGYANSPTGPDCQGYSRSKPCK